MAKSKKSGSTPKPKSDAYVGLLMIALLAQIAGAIFLYLEYTSYPESGVPKIQTSPVASATPGPGPGPAPGPGPMPMPPMPMPPMNP
jgi:hypothetical protein